MTMRLHLALKSRWSYLFARTLAIVPVQRQFARAAENRTHGRGAIRAGSLQALAHEGGFTSPCGCWFRLEVALHWRHAFCGARYLRLACAIADDRKGEQSRAGSALKLNTGNRSFNCRSLVVGLSRAPLVHQVQISRAHGGPLARPFR